MPNNTTSSMEEGTNSKAAGLGPIPFWWWVGEGLDRERIIWQLDRLKENGVFEAIVSYNHHADGSPNRGEPPVFSDAWWKLFREVLGECKARGMRLGFQDYTLLNPVLEEIGKASPDMAGGGELREAHHIVAAGDDAVLCVPGACVPVAAFAYPLRNGVACVREAADLRGDIRGSEIRWSAPEGNDDWLLSLCWCPEAAFDPMHPASGERVIRRYYEPFENEVGEFLGNTFRVSFQDELDFGGKMPRWSACLAAEFEKRKGYDPMPLLAALWHDLGPVSAKFRIDYADVAVRLMEERYFIPIFEWHERHDLLFGNDNLGRGGVEEGRRAYGDPFRTMRWYSAPGTDDPSLDGPRAFRGLKVNSSIAHLYGRPRVWNEGFHSSGWGTTPAAVVAALNADFVLGATVVNLHGLYYSTFGGWWEWAPPDFHFRQPYWEETGALWSCSERLCEMLSEGVHVCDVAILYPITALEGGLNEPVDAGGHFEDPAEFHAFEIGRHLVENGIDFDFLDFESLERAEISGGALRVAGEEFRVLIFPFMSSTRFSSIVAARDFARSGGLVAFYGCRPVASERAGAEDPELEKLVDEILGTGRALHVEAGVYAAFDAVNKHLLRDFDPAGTGLQAVHRRTNTADTYFVFNPGPRDVNAGIGFRSVCHAARIDPWSGREFSVTQRIEEGRISRIGIDLAAGAATVIRFDRSPDRDAAADPPAQCSSIPLDDADLIALADGWECELDPVLDNRFGDFRLPATPGFIGAEARGFRYAEESGNATAGCESADFDDTAWAQATYSHGQKFWRLGPLPASAGTDKIGEWLAAATSIDPLEAVIVAGSGHRWQAVDFSYRWGIENDPHLKDWASGPHGLKGIVPDEFIDCSGGTPGSVWFFWTTIEVPERRETRLVTGSRAAHKVWLNGRCVWDCERELPPGRQSVWNLPHYHSDPARVDVVLEAGINPMLLRFVQPAGQRVRGYAAFEGSESNAASAPALRWFTSSDHPVFNPLPGAPASAHWFRFKSAPGLRRVCVVSRAPARAWSDGTAMRVIRSQQRADGLFETRFEALEKNLRSAMVAIRTEPLRGFFGGEALPEPVLMECETGEIQTGDWCGQGLESYSGRIWYRRTVCLCPEEAARAESLDLGSVIASADVRVNGMPAGKLIAPPWRAPVHDLLHPGENRIEIRVANTLANHWHIGIPTPYAPEGQTVSGLLGPVTLRLRKKTI